MTEHTLNIDTDIDDARDSAPAGRRDKSRSSVITIIVSILLHVFVLGVILKVSFNRHQIPVPPEKPVETIKARLYFPPPKPEPIQELTIEETKPIPELEQPVEVVEVSPQDQASLPEPADEQAPVPEVNPEPSLPETAASEQNIVTEDTSRYTRSQRLNNALNSHLESLQQQKLNEMTGDIIRNRDQVRYQQSLEHYQPPAPEPEVKTKKIDCSSTAGEIAGMLSGLTGGNLRCSDKPDFQKYIDARLNKGSQTP